MLGVGVLLRELAGGSDEDPQVYIGLEIKNAKVDDRGLILEFTNDAKIILEDAGQSCCESRYVTCDDDASVLIGKKLTAIKLKDAPSVEAEYGEHETMFVEVQAEDSWITLTTHNEHNGYYGGFSINIKKLY